MRNRYYEEGLTLTGKQLLARFHERLFIRYKVTGERVGSIKTNRNLQKYAEQTCLSTFVRHIRTASWHAREECLAHIFGIDKDGVFSDYR